MPSLIHFERPIRTSPREPRRTGSRALSDLLLGQPTLRVDGRHAAGAGRRDRLPVDLVRDVPAGEYSLDGRPRAPGLDAQIARVVELELSAKEVGVRLRTKSK